MAKDRNGKNGDKGTNGKTFFPDDDAHPRLKPSDYKAELKTLQRRMRAISLAYHRLGLKGIVVVEGTDTAGKGGAIRRLTSELDPRHFDVWPIGPPSEDELRRHYLWRFWERLPQNGVIGIFDRSWYGRVLVERVDGLTAEENWRRAYDEIRAFEEMQIDGGARLVKLYLHVTAEEQRARLAERVKDPYKRWKVAAADFRSHLLRDRYLEAAEEMFGRTSTARAPWTVIAGDDKHYARVAVLDAVTKELGRDIDVTPQDLDPETLRMADEVLGTIF